MPSFNPSVLAQGARATFFENFSPESSMVDALAFLETSNRGDETYAWLGQPPQLQELTDSLAISGLSDSNYGIVNVIYAGGLEFFRKDLDDDATGGLRRRILQLADVAGQLPNKVMSTLIANGETGLGYDGVSFFNVAHPIRNLESATQSNLLTGSGTTTAAFATDFSVAKAKLVSYQAENAEPIHGDGQNLSYIVQVHPSLERVAREALSAGIISNNSNVLQGAATVMLNPRFSDLNDWYLYGVSSTMRPFIHQERDPVEFTEQDPKFSDIAFLTEKLMMKARRRMGQGYGYWQSAIKTTN